VNLSEQETQKAIELAEESAEIVEKGWMQGWYNDGEGNYCAVGAMHRADHSIGTNERVRKHVIEVAQGLVGYPGGKNDIPKWNDTPGRTQAEVADMWRTVAKEIANNA
jgi:hypothetical protein